MLSIYFALIQLSDMVKKLYICKHRNNYYRYIYINSGDLVVSVVGFAF